MDTAFTRPQNLTKQELSEVDGFELENGLLYRMCAGKPLLVVPKSMRKGIVIAAHDFGGHFSVDRTITRKTFGTQKCEDTFANT